MANLNEQQTRAASFTDGVAVVIAVPGSGKTLTMTHRISRLVNSGVSPESILGLTFTRNAANEMRTRLVDVLQEEAPRVMLSTIHSFCHHVLRCEGVLFDILEGKDRLMFIRKIMGKLGIKDISVGMVLKEIALAKNNLIVVEEFFDLHDGDKAMLKVAEVFQVYEDDKNIKMLKDFDDLLLDALDLLKNDPDILDKYRSMFRHLMVDEYQDTNPAQVELLRLLVGEGPQDGSSFWVCGDDWQAIYAFTGASVSNILGFQKMFPESIMFMLNVNYRSTPQILAACQNLVRHNRRKIDKTLETVNGDGEQVVVLETASENEEALIVASEIKDLTGRGNYQLKDIAVLLRCNFQSRVIEEVFSQQGIAYHIENGLGFYRRREIKCLLDYLRLISEPESTASDEAFKGVVNIPTRYVSRKFIEELEDYALGKRLGLFQALKEIPVDPSYLRKHVKKFIELIDELSAMIPEHEPGMIIRRIREILDYDRVITDEDIPSPDDQKIQNINQLQLAASRFEQVKPFLEHVSALEGKSAGETKDGVRIMTIHKAKGLEFPVVFVPGMVEGILPTKKGELEEERRICFVAISRAMKRLYLCWSHTYLGLPANKSPFIGEMELGA